jgi:HD-GYP domain-containing protein (c-di-GMP phosphodiesterase class II)
MLSELLGISKLLVAESDLDELLNLIMAEATRLTCAERSSLFLRDEHTGELISFIAQKAEVREIRVPLGRGVAGQVAETGELVNLHNAYESELFDGEWDRKTGFKTECILCVPMRNAAGQVTGVVQVLNRQEGPFTEADETTLSLFASHAAIAIENLRLREDMKLAFRSGIRALAQAVDQRDPATAGHSERVTFYAVRIAEAMGLAPDEITALEYAATLHDVGKIAVPDSILAKQERLTSEEYEIVKGHANITRDILSRFHFSGANAEIPKIAAAHHERLDGSGYPDQLRDKDLPMAARILAVADVYDAVTSFDRPYRQALSPEEAIELLIGEAGITLDEQVVHTFVSQELYRIERRRFVRLDIEKSIEYRILPRDRFDAVIRGQETKTRDISGHGLRFVEKEFIPVGTYLETTVHLEDSTIELLSKVVRAERVDPAGLFEISVAFVNLTQGVEQSLQEHLVTILPG